MRLPHRHPTRGFTLVEVAVVLIIVAVLIAMAATITRGVTAAQQRALTNARIAGVDAALLQFVTTQRRLPCPADATLATTNANYGKETARNSTGCTTNQANGVVPWRDLGLSEVDASDAWNRRLTYRLYPALAADAGMDMTWCDPAGANAVDPLFAAPATRCISSPSTCGTPTTTYPGATVANCTAPSAYLSGKGLEVRNLAGAVLMNPAVATPHTGAAYVVISHGETGGGGYLLGGTLGASSTTDGTEELKNYASQAYGVGSHYIDDTLVEGVPGHFDDVVSRPSLMSVITKAGLGPRAH